MGETWISWRTTTTIIITVVQIQALISVKTKAFTGVEGQGFDLRCEYADGQQNNAKYFSRVDDNISSDPLIWTDKHNQWVEEGRYSLYDNTTGAFFSVSVNELVSGDSGTYWCGVDISSHPDQISVVQLNVSQANHLQNQICYATKSPPFSMDEKLDKLHLPLYLTAVMCVMAILGVGLFTLCLLLAAKRQRSGRRQNRETSSDYETMMPGISTDPELRCSAQDSANSSSSPHPPVDLGSHVTSKHRESAVTLGFSEYVDVEVPGYIGQYQLLDLSRLEEHVYHSLHGNSGPKDVPLGIKEPIQC